MNLRDHPRKHLIVSCCFVLVAAFCLSIVVKETAFAWFGVKLTGQANCEGVTTWTLTGDDEHAGTIAAGPFAGSLGVNDVRTATTSDTTLTVTVKRADANRKLDTVTAEATPTTGCEPEPEEPPVVTPPKPDKPDKVHGDNLGPCEVKTCARDPFLPPATRTTPIEKCGQLLGVRHEVFKAGKWRLDHITYLAFDPRECDADETFVETGL